MKEIELKILEINEKEMIKRIISLGGRRILNRTLFDEKIFDFKNRSLKKSHCLLRLRKEGKTVALAFKYKGRKDGNFKVSEETDVMVGDFKDTEIILKRLGLNCVMHRKKIRSSYLLGKVRIEIDKYPEIPIYMELEGSKKEILKVLKLLSISLEQTTDMNIGQVFNYYGVKSKVLI